jgi:hypothetical protein
MAMLMDEVTPQLGVDLAKKATGLEDPKGEYVVSLVTWRLISHFLDAFSAFPPLLSLHFTTLIKYEAELVHSSNFMPHSTPLNEPFLHWGELLCSHRW